MLVNKDQLNAQDVRIVFQDRAATRHFAGEIDRITFGSEQYEWHPSLTGGSAEPDGPAFKSKVTAVPHTRYTLPKASITVLRGRLTAN
jgi:hypothetical protein